jgi:hypothetical protein
MEFMHFVLKGFNIGGVSLSSRDGFGNFKWGCIYRTADSADAEILLMMEVPCVYKIRINLFRYNAFIV